MIEAVILAGGMGTRLSSIVSDRPKCMALVAGHPFLHYILDQLSIQNVQHVVLALGYLSEQVIQWIDSQEYPFEISFSIEDEPLGTGGAIKRALSHCKTENVLVLNGDSYTSFQLSEYIKQYHDTNADTMLLLYPMHQYDRYGTVIYDPETMRVLQFQEKMKKTFGEINAGVYIINRPVFYKYSPQEKFSFERDFLEKYVNQLNMYAYITQGIFIDIGVPADYELAQSIFKDF